MNSNERKLLEEVLDAHYDLYDLRIGGSDFAQVVLATWSALGGTTHEKHFGEAARRLAERAAQGIERDQFNKEASGLTWDLREYLADVLGY